MTDFERLEPWLNDLLQKLSGKERLKLTRGLARELRQRNQSRIKRQIAPDGTPYQPRKTTARQKKGGIKRSAMFTKLRLSKHLKTSATAQSATIAFMGRVGRIAEVHHRGLRDTVTGRIKYQYPERQLLGMPEHDINYIADRVLQMINSK